MTLASQSSNAEFAQAGFVVKREKEQMDIVSMYYKKLKEAQAEVACIEVSQKCDGKECQENVSFVEFFEAMDALTKNFFGTSTKPGTVQLFITMPECTGALVFFIRCW